ncbi:MAG: glycosyltransferase family 39 protein [Actinobacteria bacterium]|nr:glycosyltransferase family 39 protein [Actinomycetota bacterium]
MALATVLTLAAVAVEAQPIRSPWWTYADADATYTASALNLMLGEEVTFVDHPGLPITEAVAVAAGIDALASEGSLSQVARLRYVDRTLLDLDGARWLFRGFAVAFYLLGALLAFLLASRLFGHWSWGLANGLFWLAAPGLIAMSIQLRPDVLLAVLCLVFAFAIARAVDRRSVAWYAAAGVLVGFTTMVKLHALALLLPLLLAALWRPPAESELAATLERARGFVRAHRVAVGSIVGLWLALAVVLNWDRFPFDPSESQLGVTLAVLAVGLAAVGLAEAAARVRVPRLVRRVASRFHALLVVSFIGGLLIPVTLDVQDGTRALLYIVRNVSGRGVQEGIEPYSTPLSALDGIVGTPIVFAFLLAALAGIVGVLRREPVPVVWAVAALATGVFAYARPPNVHYFAPAFVFAALALLWLLQRESRARMPILAWLLVLYIVWPAWDNRLNSTAEQERFAASVASAKQYVDANLPSGEFVLVPSYWPFADSRYFELVQIYVAHSPEYPYRYLPATAAVRSYEQPRQMRPRFYIGPLASNLTVGMQVELGDLGPYTIVPREGLVAEIVNGPGVTEPW